MAATVALRSSASKYSLEKLKEKYRKHQAIDGFSFLFFLSVHNSSLLYAVSKMGRKKGKQTISLSVMKGIDLVEFLKQTRIEEVDAGKDGVDSQPSRKDDVDPQLSRPHLGEEEGEGSKKQSEEITALNEKEQEDGTGRKMEWKELFLNR